MWGTRIRHWVAVPLIIAVALGVFWTTLKRTERAGGPSPAAALSEALSKAARQRILTP
jgi:hypothetical protein